MLPILTFDDLFREDFVMLRVEAGDMEDLMRQMCDFAHKMGYVKESYLDAVLERESLYPTGLPMEVMKLALPHTTDKCHVVESGIFIARLERPVAFKEMGDGERDVLAEMVFMMAVNGSDEQLAILQNIVGMFANPESLLALKNAMSKEEIIEALRTHIEI